MGSLILSPSHSTNDLRVCVCACACISCSRSSLHVACSSNCSPDTQINHVDICVSIGVNSPSSGSNQYFSERGTAACFMVRCLSYSPLCRGVDQQREMIWRAVGKASVHVWCFLVKNGHYSHSGSMLNQILYAPSVLNKSTGSG